MCRLVKCQAWRRPQTWGWALSVVAASAAWSADGIEFSGEARALWTARDANAAGPLAQARTLRPGINSAPADSALAEAELRVRWQGLGANLLLSHERPEGGPGDNTARFNELQWSGALDAAGTWQASLGKKIVAWDVGYGFRPNDVVAQQARRTLLDTTPEGRPLLMLERFDADDALALVWVNPQRLNHADSAQRLATESALAGRWYHRAGAVDLHGVARLGQHTGASLGAALAWVATDEVEVHASARVLQRHDGWQQAPGTGLVPVQANPWQVATGGGTGQWQLGVQWTGASRHSLLLEAWHDGTAPSDTVWREWRTRNAALVALGARPGLPADVVTAVAGNLAWQASPWASASLRRDNLFLRWAWQPEAWVLSVDALVTPADGGRTVTAGAQWQGDRWRLNAAWRLCGGPRNAVLAQLPSRHTGLVAATLAF